MKATKRILIALAILFVVYGAYITGYTIGRVKPDITADAQPSFLQQINDIRTARGLPAMTEDNSLDATALIKANDMAAKNYFDHNAPDGTPWYDFIQKNRPGSERIGENLAECFTDNTSTIAAWVKSEGHFKNMIGPDWTKFGTATVWDADRSCYLTVNHFGR